MKLQIISGIACFVAGALSSTKGVEILKNEKTRELAVKATAAALRGKDCVMDAVTSIQENAEDILAEARMLNEETEDEIVVEIFE